MANLQNVSTEDLEKELESRKQKALILEQLKPVAFDEKRHARFIKFVEESVYEEINGQGKDVDHYIYEEAVTYVFGDKAFDKINKLI
jgi:hypothetical protein